MSRNPGGYGIGFPVSIHCPVMGRGLPKNSIMRVVPKRSSNEQRSARSSKEQHSARSSKEQRSARSSKEQRSYLRCSCCEGFVPLSLLSAYRDGRKGRNTSHNQKTI
ncbi:hypothetical protein TNCV_3243461 [Trichonephila clavipes]|nr:hypothetical protein TNCV_3243461 [Trichonephila clavipes]